MNFFWKKSLIFPTPFSLSSQTADPLVSIGCLVHGVESLLDLSAVPYSHQGGVNKTRLEAFQSDVSQSSGI